MSSDEKMKSAHDKNGLRGISGRQAQSNFNLNASQTSQPPKLGKMTSCHRRVKFTA
jgi:hypothetical protein